MPPAETMKPREDVVAIDAQPAQGSDEAKGSGLAEFIQSMEVAAPVVPSDAGTPTERPQRREPATPAQMLPAVAEPQPAEAAPGGSDIFKPAPTDDPAKPVAPPIKAGAPTAPQTRAG